MPKPPEESRLYFPFRGVTDRGAFVEAPGDAAPWGTTVNVRPDAASNLRQVLGGQRPGLRQVQTPSGQNWGRIGDGPIQLIRPIARPARVTGYAIGACASTHAKWESRSGYSALTGNLFTFRQVERPTATPPVGGLALSRSVTLGTTANFLQGVDTQRVADLVWTDWQTLFGGVNEVPRDNPSAQIEILFKAIYLAGQANNGYGSPAWTNVAYPAAIPGTPLPLERVTAFPWNDTPLAGLVFAGITVPNPPTSPDHGWLAAFNLVAGTSVAYRPDFSGVLWTRAVDGTWANRSVQGTAAQRGSRELTSIKAKELGGAFYLYFCYRANPGSESVIGRFKVTSTIIGDNFSNVPPLGEGFQINGGTFIRGDNIRYASTLFRSLNFPRGATPTDVSADSVGSIYYTRSSTGWGPRGNSAPGTDEDHKPWYPGAIPVTVVKVTPAGAESFFAWEASTGADTALDPHQRVISPELLWCEADDDGVFVGGRRVNGNSVHYLDGSDGRINWSFDTGGTALAAAIDPEDGNPIVVGPRNSSWTGAAGASANCWKIDRTSGELIWAYDVGKASLDAVSISINPVSKIVAIGCDTAV